MKLIHYNDLPRPVGLGMPVMATGPGWSRIGRIEDYWVEGEGLDTNWKGIIVWFVTLKLTMCIEWEEMDGPNPLLWFVDGLPWSEKVIGSPAEPMWGLDDGENEMV